MISSSIHHTLFAAAFMSAVIGTTGVGLAAPTTRLGSFVTQIQPVARVDAQTTEVVFKRIDADVDDFGTGTVYVENLILDFHRGDDGKSTIVVKAGDAVSENDHAAWYAQTTPLYVTVYYGDVPYPGRISVGLSIQGKGRNGWPQGPATIPDGFRPDVAQITKVKVESDRMYFMWDDGTRMTNQTLPPGTCIGCPDGGGPEGLPHWATPDVRSGDITVASW